MDHEIAEELAALAATAPDFSPRPLKDPNNKGIVRSGFQKAMRRGQTERALRLGEYLIDYDDTNAWRTMATVLVEDIGFGDLDLLAYGTVTTLKTVRNSFGGEEAANRLFAAMIARACEAPKSRSCCELSLGADKAEGEHHDHDKMEMGLFAEMRKLDEATLMDHMCEKALDHRYVAACALRKKLRGQGADALFPTLQRIMEELDDPAEARACMMSFERTVDDMNLALFPIVHRLNSLGQEIEAVDETPEWPEEVIIKSVSSSAFDMHTGVGARATKAFYNRLKDMDDWAVQITSNPDEGVDPNPMKSIGSLVFIVEGGLLDTRLLSPALRELKTYQDTNFAKGYGIPSHLVDDEEIFAHMLQRVREEIPLLNELRQWSAKK